MKCICITALFYFILFPLSSCFNSSDETLPDLWRANLVRKNGDKVVFMMSSAIENNKMVFYVHNADENLRVDEVTIEGDSIFFHMPFFESSFRVKKNEDGSLSGTWTKGTAGETQHWEFYAIPGQSDRYLPTEGNAKKNISGKWDVTITRANGTLRKAIAEFEQNGNRLTGTVLTPTGDYRYLDGIVTGDSLILSTFDGAHTYTFYARISDDSSISNGLFYAGYNGMETWEAKKNNGIITPEIEEPTRLRDGEQRLDFTFYDMDDKPVSINDDRFKDKVIIIQIMGSWCPNCMDETKFLSNYFNENRSRGVEVIALAYEYSTDLERSKKSLVRFRDKFNVQYPMLITGVSVSDEKRTEKTLPQLTPIRSFPTTIFLDKKGNVRKIHSVFYGPGTGEYFESYKEDFNSTVNELLNEK